MYTVEKIEDKIVILEDRKTNKLIDVKIDNLPKNIKEGDIINNLSGKYIIDKKETNKIKNNIRNKFNLLKK